MSAPQVMPENMKHTKSHHVNTGDKITFRSSWKLSIVALDDTL